MDCGMGEDALSWLIDGFNATVVAFGQMGTGKTHSLFGQPAEPVCAHRAKWCSHLTQSLKHTPTSNPNMH